MTLRRQSAIWFLALASHVFMGSPALAQPFVYAAGTYTNSVEVYDVATDTVVASIPVCANPYGVAVSPNGARVYVACEMSNAVAVIDTLTNQVARTIAVGLGPWEVTFSPNGARAYVTNDTSVSVIDASTELVVASYSVPGANNLHSVRSTADNSALYVSDVAGRTTVLDQATGTVLATFADGQTDVELSATGHRMFVTGKDGGNFLSFDTSSHTMADAIGSAVYGVHVVSMAVSGDGRHVFQAHAGTPRTFTVLDVVAKRIVAGGFVGGIFPLGIALDSTGRCLFIRSNFTLDVFNVKELMDTIPVFAVSGFTPASPAPFRRSFVNGNGTIAVTGQPAQCGGDSDPPVSVVTQEPAAGPSGWNSTPVSVSILSSDGTGSGVQEIAYSATGAQPIAQTVVSGDTAFVAISAEGVTAVTYQAVDEAGNLEIPETYIVQVDSVGPTISVASPTPTTYTAGEAITSAFTCSDETSGLQTCNGPVGSGAAVATGTVGNFSFTVTASDAAGNTAESTVDYSVSYGICTGYDVLKAHKRGSTIPIKVWLCDAQGNNVSAAQRTMTASGVQLLSSAVVDAVEDAGDANADSNFRYDSTNNHYIFNLSTANLAVGRWLLSLTVTGDPVVHTVGFTIGR
jgi:YVTN family beta-propeller protein